MNSPKPLGTIWICCDPYAVATIGLKRALEERAEVHVGRAVPSAVPLSCQILCIDNAEDVAESVRRARETHPVTPILVFGPGVDLSIARIGLQAGARGFIHGGMSPEQVTRAVEIATKGEMVAPRQLLEHVIEHITANEEVANLSALSPRQLEILSLVVEGMSNAEIGRRLYLSESTIKQHLRAAYKVLGVSNRTEASKLVRQRLGS